MISQDAINAFQQASGLSAEGIVEFIKAIIILSSLLIYGFCLLGVIRHLRNLEIIDVAVMIGRTIFLLSLIISCFTI